MQYVRVANCVRVNHSESFDYVYFTNVYALHNNRKVNEEFFSFFADYFK